ncbi:LuxR C-terminal-related transcriptional regulator [Gandjariella thermophila]|nr:LuxR C-terminal-related transcriptional regulator [Gandjariella thermophila]
MIGDQGTSSPGDVATLLRPESAEMPAELASFVGRRRELSEARSLLSRSRLLTFTGVGGVGKSRLALRLAAAVRGAYPDGVRVVNVAALSDGRALTRAVGDAFDLPEEHTCRGPTAVAEALAGARSLLVLDNCDRLTDACAELVLALLRTVADMRIVATSRSLLGVFGEHVLAVTGLSVPEPDQPVMPKTLLRYEAPALFAERRAAIQPGFRIDADNCAMVAVLCRRLDGNPLQIELAARRPVPTIEQLVQRSGDRFEFLATQRTLVEPRHRSLRALISSSFELCSPRAQEFWARLSVFPRDFDLAAAEEVCSGGRVDRAEVLDLVTELVNGSILLRHDYDGQPRFRLPSAMREYGRERLAARGDERVFLRRHRDWCLSLARRAEAEWPTHRQLEWFARLHSEHLNLRAAIDFSLATRDEAGAGAELAAALGSYWIASGRLGEGRRCLDRALTLLPTPAAPRAKALRAATVLALLQGDISAGLPLLAEYRTAAHDLGDRSEIAHAAQCSGLASICQADFEQAHRCLTQALAEHRALGDLHGVLAALVLLATAAALAGDGDRARTLGAECVATSQALGEAWYRSYAQWAIGDALWQRGEARQATELVQDSVRLHRHFNDWLGVGLCLGLLAHTAVDGGEGERAAQLLGACRAASRKVTCGRASAYRFSHGRGLRCAGQARDLIGSSAFTVAFSRGTELSHSQVLALVLGAAERKPKKVHPATENACDTILTPREHEVARLIAKGMSNKQIATTLVISQRTVGSHVEHILCKLGFTSRSQVASWLARSGEG